MISTYKDIQFKVDKINSSFDDSAQIQKIYSSSYYISLQIRIPGQSKFLIIGRGHNHEGIWIHDKQIPSELRKKDRFLEYLRKHIAGCGFLSAQMDTKDRAFSIKFSKWRRECELFLFYNSRELYFQTKIWSNSKGEYEFFQSWRGKIKLEEMSFSDFDEVGRKDISDKQSNGNVISAEKALNTELKAAKGKGVTPKSLKFLKRKLKNISEDLEIVLNYKKLEAKVDDIDYESLPTKATIDGVKLKFKKEDHYNRRNELFIKIKKLKKAEDILKLRLSDTQDKLDKLKSNFNKAENKLKVTEPVWKILKSEVKTVTKSEYVVKALDGLKVGVGKSSKGNDQLRTEFASKDDWWFHLSDRPSSHIVVKDIPMVSGEIIELIGNEFCEIEKSIEVDIVYTQVKNLKSVKGKSGLVRYRKEKYFRYNKQTLT